MTELNNNHTKYIVTIFKYKQSDTDLSFKWEKYDDGYAYISQDEFGYKIKVSTLEEDKNNYNQYYNNITNNMRFEFKTLDSPKRFNVFIETETNKIGLQFDNNSSSAFNNFKDELNKQKDKRKLIKYYESGNIKYVGEGVDDEMDGNGCEYYDTNIKVPKYIGEFENNKYDGSGKFFSYDNNFEIQINNISRNRANGNCTLTFKNKNKNTEEIIKKVNFNFSEVKDFVELTDDNFCDDVGEYLIPNYKEILFNQLTTEDKLFKYK